MVAVVNVVMGMAFTLLPIPEMIYHYTITGEWGFDCLFCILSAHLCVHFMILKYDLENITNESIDTYGKLPTLNERLFNVVQKHQKIEEYKKSMDVIFNFALFYNFFVSSFIICIQGFMVTAASGYTLVKFALFLASFLVELFLLCFYGQHIVESSVQAAEAAYNCPWYNTNRQFRTIILQMINKAQIPLTLMAWKIWPVDLNTFASILSASWSYFTLLRTVYAD
ncbi:odorant receptor 4-like [Ochlerotatus camptorhynchus]|uniref:odorant receptor 4-like n=1 Tax=Ochlerotatus camptorhynchus TaxID=644619 RepID=UPI0031D38402